MKRTLLGISFVALFGSCTTAPPIERGPRDAAELAAFIDPLIEQRLREEHVPGAVFVYVKDGRVLYSKGYGFANVERKVPVSPETTIWRIGSISKVFTSTALMQLVSRGSIALDGDVNAMLRKLQVKSSYPRPITPRMLMTHSAGFDEIRPGTQAATEAEVLPLADFLRPRLEVIRPPGEFTVYSTYGITLAGLLIEEQSGLPFERYMQQHIWSPLGMTRTNITVPAALKNDLAIGYERAKSGELEPQAWEWYHTTPASSINSTAHDMAKFMIAHLSEDSRLMKAESLREMHKRQQAMHPRISGWALGFSEDFIGGLRVIEHGGNMAGFSSQMVLIPSAREGFFFETQFEGGNFRNDLKYFLLERFFPSAKKRLPVPPANPEAYERMKTFAGRYSSMTSCHTCKPRSVPGILTATANPDGSLSVLGNKWYEVEPMLFVTAGGTGYMAARNGDDGKPAYLFPGSFWAFERLPEE